MVSVLSYSSSFLPVPLFLLLPPFEYFYATDSLKVGKVVILLSGRFAGKKAIVVKANDANKRRKFPHVLVAGLARTPVKVTKSMSRKKVLRRVSNKPFLKYINVTHVMPTRYSVKEIDLKSVVTPAAMASLDGKRKATKAVKGIFFKKYVDIMFLHRCLEDYSLQSFSLYPSFALVRALGSGASVSSCGS